MSVGQSVIFSQPRGDRVATMEDGGVQIFFLIPTIISNSFLSSPRIALSGKSK